MPGCRTRAAGGRQAAGRGHHLARVSTAGPGVQRAPNPAVYTALGYFETNAPRMRYKHFRSLGLFVGSGAVEAGCKAVIGQRLKLSGMHWSQPGATGILTLRCQQASGRREEIWQQPPRRSGAA